MYRLMIVDDEKEIRDGIAASIPWGDMGIGPVYQAENGASALDMYKKHHPQLIITDIRMPGTDGLEFMEQLQREQSPAKVVFMSGYDDFQYARRAMQLKAGDYLLKPVKSADLTTAVKKMIHELERESREHDETWMSALPILQSDFAESLLTGKTYYSEASFREKCRRLRLEWLEYMPVFVCAVEPDHYSRVAPGKKERELLSFTIGNVLRDMVGQYGDAIALPFDKASWAVIVGLSKHNDSQYGQMEHIVAIADEMRNAISRHTKVSVSVGVSPVSAEWSHLPQLFDYSLQALSGVPFTEGNKVYVYENAQAVLHREDGDAFDEGPS